MYAHQAPKLHENCDALRSGKRTGQRPARFRASKPCSMAARGSGASYMIWIAALGFAMAGLAAGAHEPPAPGAASMEPEPHAAQDPAILPRMGLEEALQAFEQNYRAPNAAGRFQEMSLAGSRNLVRELSVLNAKLFVASRHSNGKIPLSPCIHPVPLSPQRLQRWKDVLPSEVRPPQVSHQTFAVTLNGKAYVIAPAHGVRGDKRYFNPPKSDTAVRIATDAEAKDAIPLEIEPSKSPGKIVTLEGKLLTGERVRFESAAVRGNGLLQALLPDEKGSFHNSKRGVEVDYERTEIFILPAEWSYPNRLRVHRSSGFSGAPAIEKTPRGDALTGHFIGHHTVKVDNAKITLGIIEDHEAIRSAVERFAALPSKEMSAQARRPHP
jgi:hypothetical protein